MEVGRSAPGRGYKHSLRQVSLCLLVFLDQSLSWAARNTIPLIGKWCLTVFWLKWCLTDIWFFYPQVKYFQDITAHLPSDFFFFRMQNSFLFEHWKGMFKILFCFHFPDIWKYKQQLSCFLENEFEECLQTSLEESWDSPKHKLHTAIFVMNEN